MKRLIIPAALVIAICLSLGNGLAYSQTTCKIPFKFEAGGKKFPPGDYSVALKEDGKILLRRETTGDEFSISILEEIALPDPPIEGPQLMFDMVANFEPSYTEYVTEYLLAEVWLTSKNGYLVLAGERAEYNKVVKGVEAKK